MEGIVDNSIKVGWKMISIESQKKVNTIFKSKGLVRIC